MELNSETSAQGSRNQTGARCRSYQSKLRQLQLYRARGSALSNQQIQVVILHGRIKLFFERRNQTMDFINEEHVAFLKVGQQRRNVSRLFDRWSSSAAQFCAHLVSDDVRQRSFPQSRGPSQQDVIQRFLPAQRSLHINTQIVFGFALADVFSQPGRTQR